MALPFLAGTPLPPPPLNRTDTPRNISKRARPPNGGGESARGSRAGSIAGSSTGYQTPGGYGGDGGGNMRQGYGSASASPAPSAYGGGGGRKGRRQGYGGTRENSVAGQDNNNYDEYYSDEDEDDDDLESIDGGGQSLNNQPQRQYRQRRNAKRRRGGVGRGRGGNGGGEDDGSGGEELYMDDEGDLSDFDENAQPGRFSVPRGGSIMTGGGGGSEFGGLGGGRKKRKREDSNIPDTPGPNLDLTTIQKGKQPKEKEMGIRRQAALIGLNGIQGLTREDINEFKFLEGRMEGRSNAMKQVMGYMYMKSTPLEQSRYEEYRKAHFRAPEIRSILESLVGVNCSEKVARMVGGVTKVFIVELLEIAFAIRDEAGETGRLKQSHLLAAHKRYKGATFSSGPSRGFGEAKKPFFGGV